MLSSRNMVLSAALAIGLAGPLIIFGVAVHAGTKGAKTIVDTAKEAGQFNTLLEAAEAAGLVDPLEGGGPFTIFAPTDDAFTKLPEGTLEQLLKPAGKENSPRF